MSDYSDMLHAAIVKALNELGVPGEGYPAPVANAVEILSAAGQAIEPPAMTNDGGPAYPQTSYEYDGHGNVLSTTHEEPGLSLLEYFAAAAQGGLLSHAKNILAMKDTAKEMGLDEGVLTARVAYSYARSMLEERERLSASESGEGDTKK